MGATIARRAIMFALLPMLTTRVSPEEYGRVNIATTIAGLALIVMGLGLETPLFRSWFATRDDPERRWRLLTTAKSLLLLASTITMALGALIVLSIDVASEAWSGSLVALALVGSVAQTFVRHYSLPLLRAMDRTKAYLRVQLVEALVQASLLIALVLFASRGPGGWVLAIVLGQWAGVALASYYLRTALELGLHRPTASSLLRLSLPLIPHAGAHWSLAGVDRLVLLAFVPAATVGIYGLVYSVAALVGMVLTEINRALMYEYGRLVGSTGPSAASDLVVLATVQVIASLVVSFVAAAVGPHLYGLVFPAEYAAGAGVIPWIVLGYLFFGFYYIFVVRLTVIDGRTGLIAVATILGAIVNLAANLVLIPRLEMIGAALATAIGYAAMLVAVGVYVQRVVSHALRLSWRTCGMALAILTALAIPMLLAHSLPSPGPLLVNAGCSLVASGAGFMLIRRELHRLTPD